ncbi:MAG: hypothetical protein DCF16_12970 [Alphaproteobacteria bacterium]|nr:MAG: hypothetical protein DCF16_12970 [Alphaproteobacteria bacterium]
MARPKNGKQTKRITANLDAVVLARLAEIAKKQDASVAWVLRRAIDVYLEDHEGNSVTQLPVWRTRRRA